MRRRTSYKDKYYNLLKSNKDLTTRYKELNKPTVIAEDKAIIDKYSIKNDILNLGTYTILITPAQLISIIKQSSTVRIEYRLLFDGASQHSRSFNTKCFEHKESLDYAYDKIVELLTGE